MRMIRQLRVIVGVGFGFGFVLVMGLGLAMVPAAAAFQTPRAASSPPVTGATPAVSGSPVATPERRIDLGDEAGEALVWDGGGQRGTVLVHGAIYDAASWRVQARQMAAAGIAVVAVEQATVAAVGAAADYLRADLDVEAVTLVGASAGGGAVLSALSEDERLADQLVLLSATGDVSKLGDIPKLFIASAGEGLAERVEAMADDAPGAANQALILEGDAHAQAIFKTEDGDQLLEALITFIQTGHV